MFIKAVCYADMGRVEEAINVVHLLAEQTTTNSDRRRVFPLVVRSVVSRLNLKNEIARLDETYSNSRRKIERSEFINTFRRIIKICFEK